MYFRGIFLTVIATNYWQTCVCKVTSCNCINEGTIPVRLHPYSVKAALRSPDWAPRWIRRHYFTSCRICNSAGINCDVLLKIIAIPGIRPIFHIVRLCRFYIWIYKNCGFTLLGSNRNIFKTWDRYCRENTYNNYHYDQLYKCKSIFLIKNIISSQEGFQVSAKTIILILVTYLLSSNKKIS